VADLNILFKEQEFNSAMREYSRAYFNKTVPDILNQAGADLCFKAHQATRGAHYGKVRKHKPDRKTYPGRLLYAIQNPKSRQPTSHPRLAPSLTGTKTANANFLYNMRDGGRRYIATGWLGAAIRLGVNVKTRVSSDLIRSSAGKRATPGSEYVALLNGAYGSAEVGLKPLQAAIFKVAAKKRERARARIAKLNKKFSAR